MLLILLVVLSVFFYGVFLPGHVLFSNDGPLARLMSYSHKLPERFTGSWQDLNSAGFREPAAMPDITFGLLALLKPVGFSKFYVIIALTILGLGAWCFFRQSGLAPPACILGGLAAVFNSSFFSDACWGLAEHAIAVGMIFLALAALADGASPRRWLRVVLAGLAVGMAVAEGADLGAIFSVYVAIFVIYTAATAQGSRVKNLAAGTGKVALIAICAAILSARAISDLVATNVIDVAPQAASVPTEVRRWDWATQWSLPKGETLSLVVPGLYGYRIDTPNGGNYWGGIGRDPAWLEYDARGYTGDPPASGFMRYTGGGFYAGVTVVLIACWTGFQALRRKGSVFTMPQRKFLWFWMTMGFTALLIAYGRHAPFYRLLYNLPYVSLIRNPVKFLDIVNFSLIVLFAFGVDGLWRSYLRPAGGRELPRRAGVKNWWNTAAVFDKRWMIGCVFASLLALAAWIIYAALWRDSMEEYLRNVKFTAGTVPLISAFSIRQVGWFVLFLMLAVVLMLLIFSGRFAGGRAGWGAILLGVLLVADLGRADLPWIIFWDYQDKYASNPVVDFLRDKPWEHRVAIFPLRAPARLAMLSPLYRINWLQQLFPYYNIQALDIVQLSRMPDDLADFAATFKPTTLADIPRLARHWQLTNTRYLLAPAQILDSVGEDPAEAAKWLHIVSRFNIAPKPDGVFSIEMEQMTAVPATNGDYAVFEFPDALPRAKLYANWQVITNNPEMLKRLADPAFDPAHSVVVAGGVRPPPSGSAAVMDAGSVEITSYAPKDVVLKSGSPMPTVLLLNDRIDPDWKVTVDGAPHPILRCNYLMRGVYLDSGAHTIEFKYQPPFHALYVSLAALGVGFVLCGVLIVLERRAPAPAAVVPPSARPQVNSAPKTAAAPPSPKPAPQSPPQAAKSKRSGKARR